jgi:hypothetical protein
MLNEAGIEQVYLACGITDLRKSIDGLAVLVKESFELDPFSPSLFVFCNRQRDKLKFSIGKQMAFGSTHSIIFYWIFMLGGKLIHCQKGLKWYTFILSFTE